MSIYQQFLDTADACGLSYDEALGWFSVSSLILGAVSFSAFLLCFCLLQWLFRKLKLHFQNHRK